MPLRICSVEYVKFMLGECLVVVVPLSSGVRAVDVLARFGPEGGQVGW